MFLRQSVKSPFSTAVVMSTLIVGVQTAPAAAQEARTSETDTQDRAGSRAGSRSALEEIVVTARRREEALQSVPIAITAFTPDDLKANSIQIVEDLRFHTPGLQVAPSSESKAVPGYMLRGQRQTQAVTTVDQSVAIYFADVPHARPHGTNGTAIYDMESVQVLKGPQGTLFGRNTTGGAILFNPVKPILESGIQGEVTGELGDYSHYGATAALNWGGDSGRWALRLAGKFVRHDGYTESLFDDHEFDDEDSKSWRASLRWRPTETFENTFIYQHYEQDNGGSGSKLIAFDPTNPIFSIATLNGVPIRQIIAAEKALLDAADFHTVISDQTFRDREDVEDWKVINTTTWDVGGVTLKNIISYRDLFYAAPLDIDGTTARFNAFLGTPTAAPVEGGPGFPILQTFLKTQDGHQFTEEFQVLGTSFEDRLDWIVGAFYFREKNDDFQFSGTLDNRENHGIGENESYSVFAQGTYTLKSIPKLSLTAGFRYTWDDRSLDNRNRAQGRNAPALACRVVDANNQPLDPCSFITDFSDSAPTWTVGLDYQFTDDVMMYLMHRRGYRSGGLQLYNVTTENPRLTFDSETVDDFELGIKADWMVGDAAVRFNAAAFYSDYTDIQRINSVLVSNALVTGVFNAAEATIKGIEVEAKIVPTDWFELSAFYGYVDAEYDKFIDVSATPPVDISNNDFAWVPKSSAGVTARIRLPISPSLGEIWLQGQWYTQDDQFMSDVNLGPESFGVLEGYDLVNIQLSWLNLLGNENVDFRLTVRNVTDEEYYTSGVSIYDSLGFTNRFLGDPRTVVGEITYRFGQRGSR